MSTENYARRSGPPRRASKAIAACFAAAFMLVVSACAGAGGSSSGSSDEVSVRIISDPQTLQWAFTSNNFDAPGQMMAITLVAGDEAGEPIPRLASDWEVSEDETTYTFHLNDWTWSDGVPVTAEDVVYSLTEINPQYNPEGASSYEPFESVTAEGDNTVVIQLSNPSPAIFRTLGPLSGVIVPKHVYDTGESPLNNPANMDPVVAGPYQLGAWQQGTSVTLEPNPEWDGPEPAYSTVVFRIIPQDNSAVSALRSGALDVIPPHPAINPRDIVEFENDPNFQVIEVDPPDGRQDSLFINTMTEPLNNASVRQALAMAIDRQAISDAVYQGLATPSVGHIAAVGPMEQYVGDFLGRYEYNPEEAQRLLDEAGYPADANGNRMSLSLTAVTDYPVPDLASVIADYLGDIGVDVTIDAADFSTSWERVYNYPEGNPWNGYDLTIGPAFPSEPARLASYFASDRVQPGTLWSNASGLQNPELDAALDTALQTSGDESVQSVRVAEEILAEELPTVPLVDLKLHWVAAADVEGLPFGYALFPEAPLPFTSDE